MIHGDNTSLGNEHSFGRFLRGRTVAVHDGCHEHCCGTFIFPGDFAVTRHFLFVPRRTVLSAFATLAIVVIGATSASAQATTSAPKHHSKAKGAAVGAAAGAVVGGPVGAVAGAAVGAEVQHHKNKKARRAAKRAAH